mgnify:CR=1 FL=1
MQLSVYYLRYVSLCVSGVGVGVMVLSFFFFQAEDGIRDLVRSRGLGDVYKRQVQPGLPTVVTPSLRSGVAGKSSPPTATSAQRR